LNVRSEVHSSYLFSVCWSNKENEGVRSSKKYSKTNKGSLHIFG
jgi:hypothetical protein